MKRLRWTAHAETNLRERELDRAEVELTVESPDRRIAGRGERQILVRKYADKALRQPMVLCVVAEERAEETIVVTVYRSSRIEKYLPGAAP